MVLETLKNGKIGNLYWKDWKMELEEALEKQANGIGFFGKWNWIYWKMELETMKDEIGNIIKWNWKHWKMEVKQYRLEYDIPIKDNILSFVVLNMAKYRLYHIG